MSAKTKEQALEIIKKFQRKELYEMEEEMEKFFDYDAWMIEAFSKERWADAIREDEIRHIKNEGINEAIFKTAKNMLKKKIPLKDISDITGLTKKEIESLKN